MAATTLLIPVSYVHVVQNGFYPELALIQLISPNSQKVRNVFQETLGLLEQLAEAIKEGTSSKIKACWRALEHAAEHEKFPAFEDGYNLLGLNLASLDLAINQDSPIVEAKSKSDLMRHYPPKILLLGLQQTIAEWKTTHKLSGL
jgi:hypothetical protein